MDALGMILLTIPIFYPVAIAIGYDPIWFGVVIVLVTELGVITPPVGINVYVVSGIAKDVPLQRSLSVRTGLEHVSCDHASFSTNRSVSAEFCGLLILREG